MISVTLVDNPTLSYADISGYSDVKTNITVQNNFRNTTVEMDVEDASLIIGQVGSLQAVQLRTIQPSGGLGTLNARSDTPSTIAGYS
jgi:hypothetical protein